MIEIIEDILFPLRVVMDPGGALKRITKDTIDYSNPVKFTNPTKPEKIWTDASPEFMSDVTNPEIRDLVNGIPDPHQWMEQLNPHENDSFKDGKIHQALFKDRSLTRTPGAREDMYVQSVVDADEKMIKRWKTEVNIYKDLSSARNGVTSTLNTLNTLASQIKEVKGNVSVIWNDPSKGQFWKTMKQTQGQTINIADGTLNSMTPEAREFYKQEAVNYNHFMEYNNMHSKADNAIDSLDLPKPFESMRDILKDASNDIGDYLPSFDWNSLAMYVGIGILAFIVVNKTIDKIL